MRRGEWRGAEREPDRGGRAKGRGVTELFLCPGPDLAPQDGASSDEAPGKGEEMLLDIGVGGHIGEGSPHFICS